MSCLSRAPLFPSVDQWRAERGNLQHLFWGSLPAGHVVAVAVAVLPLKGQLFGGPLPQLQLTALSVKTPERQLLPAPSFELFR